MAILDAFADLFEPIPAKNNSVTPANVANHAKPRIVPSVSEVANACESLRIADEQDHTPDKFAAIRSHSQTVKTAPECARSQHSQHSQRVKGKTFAEPTKPPASAATATRPVIQFLLVDGKGGSLLGEAGDDVGELVASLVDRYQTRLVVAKHQGRIIWPAGGHQPAA